MEEKRVISFWMNRRKMEDEKYVRKRIKYKSMILRGNPSIYGLTIEMGTINDDFIKNRIRFRITDWTKA